MSKAGRIPEVRQGYLLRAINLGVIPAIKVHGRWFVSARALAGIFGFGLQSKRPSRQQPDGGDAA